MHRDAGSKGGTDLGSPYARSDSPPKGCVQQDHIDGRVPNIRRQLFEVDNDGISRQRGRELLAQATHSAQAPGGILKIVVPQPPYRLAETQRLFDRESGVRVGAERIARERICESPITLKFIVRIKNAGLQL